MSHRLAPATLLLVVAAAATVGCSQLRYVEPKAGPNTATVTGQITGVDGFPINAPFSLATSNTVRVTAGRHTFAMTQTSFYMGNPGTRTLRFPLIIQPAQTYRIEWSSLGQAVTLRNDTTNHEIYFDLATLVYFDKNKAPLPNGFDQPPSP